MRVEQSMQCEKDSRDDIWKHWLREARILKKITNGSGSPNELTFPQAFFYLFLIHDGQL